MPHLLVRHRVSCGGTFELYVHRDGPSFIGLCTELKEVIEGSTADDIVVKAKALIDSVSNRAGTRKPRITVRMSPNLQNAVHNAR
ncbi:MAG: hypothetical protein WA814_02090 [Candidatus Baltobacteraceae bacterium]